MKQRIIVLCVLVVCSFAAPLSLGNSSASVPASRDASDLPTNAAVTVNSAETSARGSLSVFTTTSRSESITNPARIRPIPVPPKKVGITFHDWFSQLSLWIQIPLAVLIFFGVMFLLVILLNIIFFWCALCCACGLACFIPDDYVRL